MNNELKFGTYFPWYSWEDAVKTVTYAEENGFDSVWMADHPADWAPVEHLELWTTMSALAAITKKIELCFGVTDPHRRHPSTMAHGAVTIDYISKGRLKFGIGPGEAMNLVPYGINWDKPVSKLEEAIIVMKKLWTEKSVDFNGEFFKLKDAILPTKPIQKPHPPIYIGSHGPRALEVTAKLADGWYPFLLTKQKFEDSLKFIREKAKKFGRDPSKIEPILELIAVVGKDNDKAVEDASFLTRAVASLWPQVLNDLNLNQYSKEELGLLKWTCSDLNLQHLVDHTLQIPWEPEKWLGKALVVAGDSDAVIDQLEGYAKAGVKHFSFFTPKDNIQTTLECISKSIIPYFKGK